MTTQPEPFKRKLLKTILLEAAKTLTKVGLQLLLAYFGGLFAFGTAVGFFDLMGAGYAAGGTVAGIFTAMAAKTLVKDVATMPARIQTQQKEARLEHRLATLEKAQKQPKNQPRVMPRLNPTQAKKVAHKTMNKAFWRRKKDYERAA